MVYRGKITVFLVDKWVKLVYYNSMLNKKGDEKMTIEKALELVEWLKTSYLGEELGIESAAETYDDMNDNDEFQTALKILK